MAATMIDPIPKVQQVMALELERVRKIRDTFKTPGIYYDIEKARKWQSRVDRLKNCIRHLNRITPIY